MFSFRETVAFGEKFSNKLLQISLPQLDLHSPPQFASPPAQFAPLTSSCPLRPLPSLLLAPPPQFALRYLDYEELHFPTSICSPLSICSPASICTTTTSIVKLQFTYKWSFPLKNPPNY